MNWRAIGISFLFIITILFYSLRLSVAFIHYAIFNESFTTLYCENQDKPEMECNGKCHLKKIVSAEPNKEPTNAKINELLHIRIPLFVVSEDEKKLTSTTKKNPSKTFFHLNSLYLFLWVEDDVRPPQQV